MQQKIMPTLPADPLFHKPPSIIAAKRILYAGVFMAMINWALRNFVVAVRLDTDSMVGSAIIFVLTMGLILWLIRSIGLAKKWARVVLLVLYILGVAIFPWSLLPLFHASMLLGVLLVFEALLNLLALIFLFSKESTRWFNRAHLADLDEPAAKNRKGM
jgi:hypothetical protein